MGHCGGLLAMGIWLGRINFMSEYYDDPRDYGDEYIGHSKYDYIVKECKRCGRKVEMSSDHGICDSCASNIERGWEY